MKSIGIVIPAYNERENILKLIKEIRKKLNCIIIIVDDSSDLKTSKILKKSKIRNLKYYNRGKKSGRGSAVLFGFKKILKMRKNISCFIEMDADLSHSPSELKRNISYFFSSSIYIPSHPSSPAIANLFNDLDTNSATTFAFSLSSSKPTSRAPLIAIRSIKSILMAFDRDFME